MMPQSSPLRNARWWMSCTSVGVYVYSLINCIRIPLVIRVPAAVAKEVHEPLAHALRLLLHKDYAAQVDLADFADIAELVLDLPPRPFAYNQNFTH